MSLTFTDLFCGAGGTGTGMVAAGFELKLAANHWQRAVETHAANHRHADHLCADINQLDMRRLPRTNVLTGSPICTELSPSGGRPRGGRPARGQLALEIEGHVPSAAFERTRATAWDLLRAAEVHRYEAVVFENVVEFVTDWELWPAYVHCWDVLGYDLQVVSWNAAHLGDDSFDPAPQDRHRVFGVATRKGIPLPDVQPRPLAWCVKCGKDVHAVQTWRNGRTVGKYRQQYDYRCPETACGRSLVEPYVRPAASVIDWSNLGQRIGERTKPLAASTVRRIRAGLAKFPDTRSVLTVNHSGHDGRAFPADYDVLPSRTVKIGDGLLVPCGGGRNKTASSVRDPFRTRMANPKGFEALLATPFLIEYRNHADAAAVEEPFSTVTAGGNHHGLVVPYRRGIAMPTSKPFLTMATRDSAALVSGASDIDDCYFRMVQPREQLLAQSFPRDYVVKGNKGEQTMQAGNAVPVNAAHWIGRRLAAALA